MYIITTYKGETRRLEIPEEIARAGGSAKYCAKPPADAWAAAEIVGPHWPHAAPPAPAPMTAPIVVDEPAFTSPADEA